MNFRTTFFLVSLIIVLSVVALMVQRSPITVEPSTPVVDASLAAARDVFSSKPGDVAKITIRRKGQPEWAFAKTEELDSVGRAIWKMTSPMEMTVNGVELDRIRTQLAALTYDVSYKPATPGAPAAVQTGLEPAEVQVSMTDKDGKSYSIDIGRPASDSETYVRIPAVGDALVAKSNLKSLIKPTALEYRDQQLWNLAPERISQIEVIDRSTPEKPVQFLFARDGSDWAMKAPAAAKATSKVEDMIKAISRLRVTKWEDSRKEKLSMYGLESARWTIRVTVKEESSAGKSDQPAADEAGAGENSVSAAPKLIVHELHMSDRSPVGEDAKIYVRLGDEPFAASISKSIAEKCRPVLSEWREMRLFPETITAAVRIEAVLPNSSFVLVKNLNRWMFEGENERADDAAVGSLLTNIQNLTASAFGDGEAIDDAAAGFTNPQASFQLTLPGAAGQVSLTLGGFTDAAAKRLVYARRNAVASVAKIKTADFTTLTQPSMTYQDRSIVEIIPAKMTGLTITSKSLHTDQPCVVALQQKDGSWSMESQKSKAIRADRVNELVNALGSLRADEVMTGRSLSEYGLDSPDATRITLSYLPQVEHRIESVDKGNAPAPKEGNTAEGKPLAAPDEASSQPRTIEIVIAQHDGKFYAHRTDRSSIFRVPTTFLPLAQRELRSGEILGFDDKLVSKIAFRGESGELTYEKTDGRWVLASEKDLRIDSKKVQNLILQFKDLKTDRFIGTSVSDVGSFGLSAPAKEFTIFMEDGSTQVLQISAKSTDKGVDRGFYAAVKGKGEVFLLTTETLNRLEFSPDKLEQDAK